MNEQEKQQIISALKAACDNTLKEQDIHRDRITVMKKIGNKDYLETLPIMGWDGINEAMADERSPISDKDRKTYLDQGWNETPFAIQVKKIEDEDIRNKTYCLDIYVEQCKRIKCVAKWLEMLGTSPDEPFAGFLYNFWAWHSVLSQLAQEQRDAGHDEMADGLQSAAKATAVVIDMFAKDPVMPKKVPLPESLRKVFGF